MANVYDVPADKLIDKVSSDLKGKIQMPEWATLVKTGHGRQRSPEQEDWWFIRAASVLRKVYLNGPVGVGRLRVWYGNRKDRGVRPEKHADASGKIIRTILKQLESLEFVKKDKRGRVITPKGQSYLDKISGSLKVKKSE